MFPKPSHGVRSPLPVNATDRQRRDARPATEKAPGTKCGFLWMQTWDGVRIEPIGERDTEDAGMTSDRFRDRVEDYAIPMM